MNHYRFLLEAVEAVRPKRILEIGTWDGGHAEEMIRAAQKYGDVEYYGFDLFAPAPEWELPKQAPPMECVWARLEATGARIALVRGNTRETLAAVTLPPIDLIFIDGGHSLETIASDWSHASKMAHTGTVILLDDYYPDREDVGAKPLVDALQRDPAWSVEVLPETEYPGLRVSMARVIRADTK